MKVFAKENRYPILVRLKGSIVWCLLVSLFVAAPNLFSKGGGPNVNGAKIYIQQNELDKAINVLLKEVEEVNKENEDAWYLLGYIYARQNKYEKMVEAFNKAVELKPKFVEKGLKVNKDTGKKFFSEFGTEMILRVVWGNAFNDAVRHFNDAINTEAEAARIELFDKSIENFRAATIIMPDSLMAYRNWSAALMNSERYEESIAPLQMFLSKRPGDSETRALLASAFLQSGKREEAKAVYREGIEADPTNFKFLVEYGTLLLDENDYDGAITYLKQAYEIDTESATTNYQLGAAYMNRGVAKRDSLPEGSEETPYKEDYALALPHFEKSLQINPEDDQIWAILGRLAGQLDRFSLATYAFSKGDPTPSALDDMVSVGMPSDSLKSILGDPDEIKSVESEFFKEVQEWVYKAREPGSGKVAIALPLNVYVHNDRIDALMVFK